MVLGDAARIRAYVHPVRMALLRALAAAPRTVTSVAREMKVHPANLTRHFKRLLELRLIRLVETRDTGRNLEKYYRAAARSFVVRPRATKAVERQALALSILRDNLQAAIERVHPEGERAIALLASVRLRERDLKRFTKDVQALVSRFRRAEAGEGQSYSLNVSLYSDDAGGGALPPIRIRA